MTNEQIIQTCLSNSQKKCYWLICCFSFLVGLTINLYWKKDWVLAVLLILVMSFWLACLPVRRHRSELKKRFGQRYISFYIKESKKALNYAPRPAWIVIFQGVKLPDFIHLFVRLTLTSEQCQIEICKSPSLFFFKHAMLFFERSNPPQFIARSGELSESDCQNFLKFLEIAAQDDSYIRVFDGNFLIRDGFPHKIVIIRKEPFQIKKLRIYHEIQLNELSVMLYQISEKYLTLTLTPNQRIR